MLQFPNGDLFSTGVIGCDIRPVISERNLRIFIPIDIEGYQTEAVIDTGGVYLILHPAIARQIQFDHSVALESIKIETFRGSIPGTLHRATITLIAQEGNSMSREVTVFVPSISPDEWGEAPTYLGFHGCLERIRFAVDPQTELFYFAES